MIELTGLKKVRERIKGATVATVQSDFNRGYKVGLEESEDQFQSDLRAIEAELERAYRKDILHFNGGIIMALISAIHSAMGDEK